jgi:hypothetical protein
LPCKSSSLHLGSLLINQLPNENARPQHPSTPMEEMNSTTFKTQQSIGLGHTYDSAISNQVEIPAQKPSMMGHATPIAIVSAFCRAVLSTIIPRDFWGISELQVHNEHVFLRNVDLFIKLGRFESLSLHEVSQGIKVSCDTMSAPLCDAASRHQVRLLKLHYTELYRSPTLSGWALQMLMARNCRSQISTNDQRSSMSSCIISSTPYSSH